MFKSKLFCVFFLVFLLTTCISYGLPNDFDWTNRPIAIRLTSDELEGRIPIQFSSGGNPIKFEYTDNVLSVETYLDDTMMGNPYALRVQTNQDLQIKVNDKDLVTNPVKGPDGIYFFVPASDLKEGKNLVKITVDSGKKPQIEFVEMFALIFTSEEVHFDRIFGKPDLSIMVQPATDPNQLKFDILHFDLTHLINMSSSTIVANVMMIAQAIDSTNSFQTVVLDLNSNSGRFSVKSVDQGAGTGTLVYNHNSAQGRLFITLPSALPLNSEFTVRVFYAGIPSSGGTFGAPYRRETHGSPAVPIVYSFSEPYGARQWWPCKDIPDEKFTFDSHWTCPTSYFAVSNGKLISKVDNGDGTFTFNYSETYPLCSYLVSVACTNYSFVYGIYTSQNLLSTMTVGGYIYPENYSSESNGPIGTIAMINFMSKKFREYPFIQEKYVTATHNLSSSMEHQTCTSILPGGLGSNGDTRANIHELSHQWFGDAITMKHFDHLWLNEGFGTYCEALWNESKSGLATYHSYVNAWTTSDSYPLVSTSADNFSGSIVYRKGAWVLHMLRNVVGDTTFFQSLQNYINDTTLLYGNALSIDLQHHFENTMGNGTSMAWFFNEWLYQANRPTYLWGWSSHGTDTGRVLDLRITQTQGSATYIMPIDFYVQYSGGGSTTVRVWNTQYSQQDLHAFLGNVNPVSSVTFDNDNWILKNVSSTAVTFPVPTANFYANQTAGYGPLSVNFTDNSFNTPTYWAWDFGDGQTSNLQNPNHVYGAVITPTNYTVRLVVSNDYGVSTITQVAYIHVDPYIMVKLPDLKLFGGQGLEKAFNLSDYEPSGSTGTYSILSSFLGLAQLSGDTVGQSLYSSATIGKNYFNMIHASDTSFGVSAIKYSTYKIYKLPKVGINVGETLDIPIDQYTYSSVGLSIPESYGDPNYLIVQDTTRISAQWVGSTIVRIQSLSAFTSPQYVDIVAAPVATFPYGTDIDRERLWVYQNKLNNCAFNLAQDSTSFAYQLPGDKALLPSITYYSSLTDCAGSLGNGVLSFGFNTTVAGVKATLQFSKHLAYDSTKWYVTRMRVFSPNVNNSHQTLLYNYGGVVGRDSHVDLAAYILFGTPTVWTWMEAPLYTWENSSGYAQFFLKAGGPGSINIDEVQIIQAIPTLIDAQRGPNRLKYPYGDFTDDSDLNGWGKENYPNPVNSTFILGGKLVVDFTGATINYIEGIKWTANNAHTGVYTPPTAIGREVGLMGKVSKMSGNFNSFTSLFLLGVYGVHSSGQGQIAVPMSDLIASAEFGRINDGIHYTVGKSVNAYHQFQFAVKNDQSGSLTIDDVDFLQDQDDPNHGDSTLYP